MKIKPPRFYTIDNFRPFLYYHRETGKLYWIKTTTNRVKTGDEAGTNFDGYLRLGLFSNRFFCHRLVWLFEYGEWPSKNLDHIDGNPANNIFSNLREADQFENLQNARTNNKNTSGHTGVSLRRDTGKWQAYIYLQGKKFNLGCFNHKYDAINAYLMAKKEHHTFQPIPRTT